MIDIYRTKDHDSILNVFSGRWSLEVKEVIIKTKRVFGRDHVYAEPSKPGLYAFGGSFLFTSNGIYPEFNIPIPLHDRNMELEIRREK